MMVSLNISEPVGDRLKQAERPDHVGAAAELHRRHHLALGQGEIGDRPQQRRHDGDDLSDDDRRRPDVAIP
jgi:hypothetical protein